MTTLYPRATWREVTSEATDPEITPVGCILHVSGGEAESLFGYFDGPSGGIESHLHVARGPKPDGGGIEQYRDLDNEADANWHGNRWTGADGRLYGYHSVETQGTASGPWGAYQIEELAQFLAWDSQRYGYPLRLCRDPKDPGVGWHVMWGAPGEWTPAKGKVCPGRDRIAQVPAVIARAQQIVNDQTGPTDPPTEEIPMPCIIRTIAGSPQYVYDGGGLMHITVASSMDVASTLAMWRAVLDDPPVLDMSRIQIGALIGNLRLAGRDAHCGCDRQCQMTEALDFRGDVVKSISRVEGQLLLDEPGTVRAEMVVMSGKIGEVNDKLDTLISQP